ncbi:MAG TPA: hypothetical protein VIM19_07820 [Actinomycetes bacterium]
MRKSITVLVLLGSLAVPIGCTTLALADNSNRPGGSIITPEGPTPGNGGDQGWGNCGHNSSGGLAHTGDNGMGGGNGGDQKDGCTLTPPPPPT